MPPPIEAKGSNEPWLAAGAGAAGAADEAKGSKLPPKPPLAGGAGAGGAMVGTEGGGGASEKRNPHERFRGWERMRDGRSQGETIRICSWNAARLRLRRPLRPQLPELPVLPVLPPVPWDAVGARSGCQRAEPSEPSQASQAKRAEPADQLKEPNSQACQPARLSGWPAGLVQAVTGDAAQHRVTPGQATSQPLRN